MAQTFTTILIMAGSVMLFGYWFRYTCLLILSAKTTRDYAGEVARANQLSFLQVQAELRAEGPVDLGKLQDALDRDYALVTYLTANGSAESGLEDRMLQVSYKLARLWCNAVKTVSPESARRSLDEMSMVIAHFANAMGERSAAGA